MRIDISTGDKTWGLIFLLVLLYFLVIRASGCAISESPLGFVQGCHNHGIDWNAFMAPVGLVVVILLPLSAAYWLLRIVHTMLKTGAYLIARFRSFR